METKQKQPVGPPDKTKAVFKLIVYFKDGRARTYYNYHTSWNVELKKVIECEKTSLNKLRSLLTWKFKDLYKTALIIHIPTNQIFEKYVYGNLKSSREYTFNFIGGKVKFSIKDLSLKVA